MTSPSPMGRSNRGFPARPVGRFHPCCEVLEDRLTPAADVLLGNPTINFPDFSSTAGLTLNGSTALAGNLLRLTNASTFQAGTAFANAPIALTQSFQSHFQINLSGGSAPSADGLTFIIQNSVAQAAALGRAPTPSPPRLPRTAPAAPWPAWPAS